MTNEPPALETPQAESETENSTDAFIDPLWEKEVERDLLLLLQTWNLAAVIEAEKDDVMDRRLFLKHLPQRLRQPVYFPLSGEAETVLGDALAQADGMFLFECKAEIDASKWKREALPAKEKRDVSGETTISNKGGKNRQDQLTKATKIHGVEEMAAIANSCHMLVASSGYRVLDDGAVNDGLCYTLYWPFVMSKDEHSVKIDLHPVDNLRKGGATLVDFYRYVRALIKAREEDGGIDTGSLEDQLIILAKCGTTWRGYRTSQTVLLAALREMANSKKLSAEIKKKLDALDNQAKLYETGKRFMDLLRQHRTTKPSSGPKTNDRPT